MYTLHREQIVAGTLAEVWDFMRNPANLNRITPDDMDFRIVTDLPPQMRDGMEIEYRVRLPLLGRRRWVSRILNVQPPHTFTDEQIVGPYRFWRHDHELREVEGGVRVIDHVTYAPPLGPIGRLAHGLFIRRTLNRIFDFRRDRMIELFGEGPSIDPSSGRP